MKKKLKEIRKENSPKEINNLKQYNLIKNTNQNYRKIKLISKNNLPELKLSKLKTRHESDSFNFKNINNSNASSNNNITNNSDAQNKKIMALNIPKNQQIINKNDLVFPKIFNPIKNRFYKKVKNNNDSSNSFDNQNSNSNNNRSINNNMRNKGHLILSKMQNKRKKEMIKKKFE